MTLRPPLIATGTNAVQLGAGQTYLLPIGEYMVSAGLYAGLEQYDPVLTAWMPFVAGLGDLLYVRSDGQSYRLANNTGCPVAGIVSNGGSGYTSAPAVTASEGNSKWVAIVGQTISSVTVTAAGSGYVYPPLVIIQAPPPPGFPATATATLSNGTVSAVTLGNVGAGYILPPAISLINDPRDTAGSGASAIPVMANQGKVLGVICTDPYGGVGVTSGTVPTLSFSGGGGSSAAATALMCWVVSSVTVGAGGAGYSGTVLVETFGTGIPTVSAAFTNPRYQGGQNVLRLRQAKIPFSVSGGGVSTQLTGGDFGLFAGVATNITIGVAGAATPTTLATLTLVPGGLSDVIYIQSA